MKKVIISIMAVLTTFLFTTTSFAAGMLCKDPVTTPTAAKGDTIVTEPATEPYEQAILDAVENGEDTVYLYSYSVPFEQAVIYMETLRQATGIGFELVSMPNVRVATIVDNGVTYTLPEVFTSALYVTITL